MNGVVAKRGMTRESTGEVVEHPSRVKGEYRKVFGTANSNRARYLDGGHDLASLRLCLGRAGSERGGSCWAEKVGEGGRLRSMGRNSRTFKISNTGVACTPRSQQVVVVCTVLQSVFQAKTWLWNEAYLL